MTVTSRDELLQVFKLQYEGTDLGGKTEVITAFVKATGYARKYAITLLNGNRQLQRKSGSGRSKKLGKEETAALITAWHVGGRICGKRLAPFLPELLNELDRAGRLCLTAEARSALASASASTLDRALRAERRRIGRSRSTTKRSAALKSQIPIRTFTEWDGVAPGFFEVDTVSHCASNVAGNYLSTLNMTDIATCWTEPLAILRKGAFEVIAAFDKVTELLPFPILGIDSDNGSEFINSAFIDWCKTREVTQTRSRGYKKNDQAWIEQKNCSVVRKHVGRDRLEGDQTLHVLNQYYSLLRLYINFFQPCQKLLRKHRNGAKVYKKHDIARTPYQRVMDSDKVSDELKTALKQQKETLSMVSLYDQLEVLRKKLRELAVDMPDPAIAILATQRMATYSFVETNAGPCTEAESCPSARPAVAESLERLRNAIAELEAGTVIQPKDLWQFADRNVVTRYINQLVRSKHLNRVRWGSYEIARTTKELRMPHAPSENTNKGLLERLRNFVSDLPSGTVITAKDLEPFADTSSGGKYLQRLVQSKLLIRIGWGRYETVPGSQKTSAS